jgi:hypothetical protein
VVVGVVWVWLPQIAQFIKRWVERVIIHFSLVSEKGVELGKVIPLVVDTKYHKEQCAYQINSRIVPIKVIHRTIK